MFLQAVMLLHKYLAERAWNGNDERRLSHAINILSYIYIWYNSFVSVESWETHHHCYYKESLQCQVKQETQHLLFFLQVINDWMHTQNENSFPCECKPNSCTSNSAVITFVAIFAQKCFFERWFLSLYSLSSISLKYHILAIIFHEKRLTIRNKRFFMLYLS